MSRLSERRVALGALMASRAHQRLANALTTGEYADALRRASWQADGRELRNEGLPETPWTQVVACLSIWWDAAALEQTAPTWASQVDAVVVADGPFEGVGSGPSPDHLDRVLASLPCQVHRVEWAGGSWASQVVKRTALLQEASRLYPTALLVVLDADESVTGDLRQAPCGDVLWCDVTSPLYERPYSQPRGIKADSSLHYEGAHHWLYRGDRLLATHQYGGVGMEHRRMPVSIRNERGLGYTPERHEAKRRTKRVTQAQEGRTVTQSRRDAQTGSRESLRILQTTAYDAGLVGFRFHTALNTTTPHTSVFAAMGSKSAFGGPMQYDMERYEDRLVLGHLAQTADVVHAHLDLGPAIGLGLPNGVRMVAHHHGTMFRRNSRDYEAMDREYASLRLVSNLELLQYGPREGSQALHYLPNPVPVARYRQLVNRPARGPFRVAHSPSKREIKGTAVFLRAVDRANAQGCDIEPVLLEGPHAKVLRGKGTCHAAFDSFDLGMQCSGLEAAAMGVPVIAGDLDCKREYEAWLGSVPYTWANDEQALTEALIRLATDRDFYEAEALRVSQYVETHHDDAAVALRYLDLLDHAMDWRVRLSLAARAAA